MHRTRSLFQIDSAGPVIASADALIVDTDTGADARAAGGFVVGPQLRDWPQLDSYERLDNYPDDRENAFSGECQGVTHDQDHWYFATRDHLWKIPIQRSLGGVTEVDPPTVRRVGIPEALQALGYDHMGDLDYDPTDGLLYIPLEGRHDSTPRVVVFDTNLAVVDSAPLVAAESWNAAWCAVNPVNARLYASNSEGTSLQVYRRQWSGGSVTLVPEETALRLDWSWYPGDLVKVCLPSTDRCLEIPVPRIIQGGAFSEVGHLYLVSDHPNGGVVAFDLLTLQHVHFIPITYDYGTAFGREGELEGITIWDLDADRRAPDIRGQLHVIMIDNVGTDQDDLFFMHWRVTQDRTVI